MPSMVSSSSTVAHGTPDIPVRLSERDLRPIRQYAYRPLESLRHTRLLHLLPASESDQPLECSIRQKCLSDAIASYEAVSYTWGGPNLSCRLRCIDDNSELHITKNVDTFLRRFRDEYRTRVLWVDAVCINQQDHQEKSTQIPLMGQIYRFASKVLAWLGEGGIEDGAIPLIQSLSRNQVGYHAVLEAWPSLPLGYESLTSLEIDSSERRQQQAVLKRFFQLPWFRRRWIIQEIVLNAESYLHYGSHQISWFRFMTTIKTQLFWKDISTEVHSVMRVFDLWQTWSFMSSSKDLVRRRGNSNRSMDDTEGSLLSYLVSFDEYKCSDPKDMIYALGALAGIKPSTIAATPRKTKFEPDYSQSTEQCYMNLAAAAISRGHSHEILQQAMGRDSRAGGLDLPSWVPNWLASYRQVDGRYPITQIAVKGINDRILEVEITSMLLDFTATDRNSSGHIATVTHQTSLPDGLDQSTRKAYLTTFMDESLGSAHAQIAKSVTFEELRGGELCFYLLDFGNKSKRSWFRFDGMDINLDYEEKFHKDFWESPDHWERSQRFMYEEVRQLEPPPERTAFLTEVFGDCTGPARHTEDENTASVTIRYLGWGACRIETGDRIVGIKGFGISSSALVVRPVPDPLNGCDHSSKYRFVGSASLFAIAVSAEGTSDQTIADILGVWFQRSSMRTSSGSWQLPIAKFGIDLV